MAEFRLFLWGSAKHAARPPYGTEIPECYILLPFQFLLALLSYQQSKHVSCLPSHVSSFRTFLVMARFSLISYCVYSLIIPITTYITLSISLTRLSLPPHVLSSSPTCRTSTHISGTDQTCLSVYFTCQYIYFLEKFMNRSHIMFILHSWWPKIEKGVHVHGRLVWPVQLSVPSSSWSSSSQKQCSQCSRSAGPSDHQHWLESAFLCDATPEKQTNNRSTIGSHFLWCLCLCLSVCSKGTSKQFELHSHSREAQNNQILTASLRIKQIAFPKSKRLDSILFYT